MSGVYVTSIQMYSDPVRVIAEQPGVHATLSDAAQDWGIDLIAGQTEFFYGACMFTQDAPTPQQLALLIERRTKQLKRSIAIKQNQVNELEKMLGGLVG